MPNKPPAAAPERTMTARARVHEALLGPPVSPHEISDRAGIPEKDVADHLTHLQKSMKQRGERLIVKPATCLSCGYVFRGRTKLTAPGSCPSCKETHIASPMFHVEGPKPPHRHRTAGSHQPSDDGEHHADDEEGPKDPLVPPRHPER